MLVSLPRDEGGLDISIANNVRIPLSEAARSLYDKTCCYADILIESSTDSMGIILECQGRSAHDSEAASLSDAERTTEDACDGSRWSIGMNCSPLSRPVSS